MTDTNQEDRPNRRSAIRRARGGARFSGSGSNDLGSPRNHRDYDEVDDAIEPATIHRGLVTRAPSPPSDGGGNSPAQRLMDVGRRASPTYSKEYRLQLVGRLLMRRIPLDKIAEQLNVSISTIEKDRAAWKKMVQEKARSFDVNEYLGGQMELYDEVTGQALQIASMSQGENAVPTAMRLAAMRTALAGQADKTRTLQSAGVFEAARFRRSSDGSAMSDVQTLMQETREALEQLLQMDELPPPPPPRRGPQQVAQGFDDLTLQDEGDAEVMEL